MECKNTSLPYLVATNREYKLALIWRPRCKSWGCLQCGPINQATWSWRAAHGARTLRASGHNLSFVTLTSHERLAAATTWHVWPDAWDKLRKRVQRKSPGMQFFAVPEAHKDGRLHMHMITTAALPKKFWKDHGRACGLGYMSDVQELEHAGSVAAYVSKYLTKSLQGSAFARAFRRVRTSQKWPALPGQERSSEWEFQTLTEVTDMSDERSVFEARGFDVVRTDRKSAWKIIRAANDSSDRPTPSPPGV